MDKEKAFDELLEELNNRYSVGLDKITDAIGRGTTDDILNYLKIKADTYCEVIDLMNIILNGGFKKGEDKI